jgi:hypothetical protein
MGALQGMRGLRDGLAKVRALAFFGEQRQKSIDDAQCNGSHKDCNYRDAFVARNSFPSSAWERTSAKLCFASPRDDSFCTRHFHGKQSFPDLRSQAELGNETPYGAPR